VDLHHLHNVVHRHVLQAAGVVDAGIDAGRRGAIVIVERGVGDLFTHGGRLAGDELAGRIARDGDEMIVTAGEDREARRLLLVAPGE
jgi:hypothetical protein